VNAHRVFVAPHMCLHAVPWAALHDGASFLVDRMTFARVPPLLFAARDEGDDAPLFDPSASRRWLVAHEPAHPGAAPLPGLASLAGALADRVHPTIDLAGDTLTPERFLDGAASVDAVFFAGHARYDAKTPLASALLLTPSPLTATDVVEARSVLGLGHRLDLVFLLGCETSRLWQKRLSYSDEAMGLQRAFLAGGARHVLGALWPVLDRDAEDFVRALLAQEGTLDVLGAVGAAERCLREGRCPGRGISAWASFMVDAR
jgi:CHAT domain-containing protein